MSYLLNSPDNIKEVVVLSGGGDGVVNLTPPTTIRLEKAVNVKIDIKPGSQPNYFSINDHDVIPVAILGSEHFEVDLIDQSTLKFGGFSVRLRGNDNPYCTSKDVNGDSYRDLVCYFVDDSSEWTAGNDTAELWGELDDTTPFYGEDKIWIVPPKK